jgi:prepilin-type N-terminal cleavage/methylation domain-containing protein
MGLEQRVSIRHARGFTLLEVIFVVALLVVLAGLTMLITPAILARTRSDSVASNVLSTLRRVREQAISQRRNIQVEFRLPDRIVVSRIDVPGPGTTVLLDTRLEQNAQFIRFADQPDTPEAFGGAAAVDFGSADAFLFTSEGTFVDQAGDELNGTVFIGLPRQPQTAQAVTLFGPTAGLRTWRWTGSQWVE